MVWCRIGDTPLSEPKLTQFTVANIKYLNKYALLLRILIANMYLQIITFHTQRTSIKNNPVKWKKMYNWQLFVGDYMPFQDIRYASNKRSDERVIMDQMHHAVFDIAQR